MSAEWRELVAHAAWECARLGLALGIHHAPGWSSSGGTWNTPENGQQEVVTSEVRIQGPARFDTRLPVPETALRVGYLDIAVVAFPSPAAEAVRMSDARPRLTVGESGPTPGDPTRIALPIPTPNASSFIQIEFARPHRAQSLLPVESSR